MKRINQTGTAFHYNVHGCYDCPHLYAGRCDLNEDIELFTIKDIPEECPLEDEDARTEYASIQPSMERAWDEFVKQEENRGVYELPEMP